jgi:hypothetical protein
VNPNYLSAIIYRLHKVVIDAGHSLADDRMAAVYALLVLTTGQATTLENVHDAWSAWRVFTNPKHPALVPFAELSADIQAYDRPYRDAIRQVAAELEAEREKDGVLI